MSTLHKVLDIEIQREESALRAFQLAQKYWHEQRQKLTSLQHYRTEYMQKIQTNKGVGVAINAYQQVLSFVAKLDKACEQQASNVAKASMVADQRRQQWVNQQKKRKAIELVIQQRALVQENRVRKAEQRDMDEWVSQRVIRDRVASIK